MIHRFFRHIKEGFVGFKRHLGMSLSSAGAVTLTLLLVGLFIILSANLAYLTKDIENSISLVCLIDYDVTEKADIEKLQNNISSLEGVDKIEYRTKDQEFDFYNQEYPELAEFSDLYREQNPFHDVFMVNINDGELLEGIKSNIASMPGIESVEDGGDSTYTLIDILQSIRWFGAILVVALCVLAIFLIFNTIKITINSRQDEIFIMRNVGAYNGYIRAPFLVEGIIIAVLGTIIPAIVLVALYQYLYQETGGILLAIIKLIKPYPFMLYVCLAILIIGVLVGFIGSYISVSKNLRLRR